MHHKSDATMNSRLLHTTHQQLSRKTCAENARQGIHTCDAGRAFACIVIMRVSVVYFYKNRQRRGDGVAKFDWECVNKLDKLLFHNLRIRITTTAMLEENK